MADGAQTEVSEESWRPAFERRLAQILKEPGYGRIIVEIADHRVSFMEFHDRHKTPERIDNAGRRK